MNPKKTKKSRNSDISTECLEKKNDKLEELVEILSRGKYMWESTFDAITSPVQIVSGDYHIVRANLSLARISDKEITTIIGKKCFEVFADRKSPCEGCPLSQALTTGKMTIRQIKNPACGLEFEACAYPATTMGDGAMGIMYYRDITEERRLQREIIQQEKMAAIGMLAGGVAHEINNPLGGIIAFIQLLRKDICDNKNAMADLDIIEDAAGRCKKIVADLLDFSRMSKDGEKCLVDINIVLEKVFQFIRKEMQSLNVELIFDAAPRIPEVNGIPDRLQQVFLNLITNACHAMPKGGVLRVSTESSEDGAAVMVRIRDSGMGIPNEIKPKIFDPFFTTKEPGKGTGLGLSISYRIVREHGGSIHYEDVDGGGTEFIVTLPSGKE